MNPERFVVDTSKLDGDKGRAFAKATIESVLGSMEREKLKSFGPGDLVTTLEGPYAHKGLMVVEKRTDGIVLILPAPHEVHVEIPHDQLFHFDDYHEAFKVALIEAQELNPNQPQ